MLATELRRTKLILFAGIAAVMSSTVGCPSASDQGGDSETTPAAVQRSSTEPVAEAEPPPVEPSVLPEQPEAQPMPELDQRDAGPLRQPAQGAGGFSNPLRGEPPPVARDPSGPGSAPTGNGPPGAGEQTTGNRKAGPPKPRGEPFDPGWPEPKLALVITGRQEGYMEPCGCAGLDRMKGGMSRRHTLFRQLRKRGWPVVGIDVGGLAKGYGRQAEIKFHRLFDGMRKMGYDAIALGTTELKLQTGELAADAATDELQQSPFLSANVALFGFAAEMTARKRIVEAGGMKLGITAVLGKQFQKEIHNVEIEMIDPETALATVVPELKKEAEYLILLAHATMQESIELGKRFPDFDLVVTAGGAPEPPPKPEYIRGSKTLLIEVGEKGMDAIVLGLFDDPDSVEGAQPIRYQRVPLDSRFPASPEMHALMKAYQDQLRTIGFAGLSIPLGDKAPPHPQNEINGKFVGSKECESCHEISYEIWKKSPHAKAYETLAGLDPPRNFDPECVSCHVTGWHPTDHYPYRGAYEGPEKTPELTGVGCESCHGPGGAHVAAEMGSDEALQEELQKALVITKDESKQRHCYTCHDLDNSPDFDFETYWPDVEHHEEE